MATHHTKLYMVSHGAFRSLHIHIMCIHIYIYSLKQYNNATIDNVGPRKKKTTTHRHTHTTTTTTAHTEKKKQYTYKQPSVMFYNTMPTYIYKPNEYITYQDLHTTHTPYPMYIPHTIRIHIINTHINRCACIIITVAN